MKLPMPFPNKKITLSLTQRLCGGAKNLGIFNILGVTLEKTEKNSGNP